MDIEELNIEIELKYPYVYFILKTIGTLNDKHEKYILSLIMSDLWFFIMIEFII